MQKFTFKVKDELGLHARPAGELVKEAALLCGGKGGGRPDLAQSGAKGTTKITDVIAMIKNKLGLVL